PETSTLDKVHVQYLHAYSKIIRNMAEPIKKLRAENEKLLQEETADTDQIGGDGGGFDTTSSSSSSSGFDDFGGFDEPSDDDSLLEFEEESTTETTEDSESDTSPTDDTL